MQTQSRIPKLTEVSFNEASLWFSNMHMQEVLFHPEDDPAEIVAISDGTRTFSDEEVSEIRVVLDTLESSIGHEKVINAAYPVFMGAFGLPLSN